MRRFAAVAAVLALAATAARAGADLVLLDGKLLQGRSVERKEGAYLLTTSFGNVITVPVELVKEMRLTGGDAAPPTGLVFSAPRTLAGPELVIPGRREQLAAFGRPPALFQGSPMTGRWYPRDAFEGKDATNFNPVTWAKTTIDPVWWPVPGFSKTTEVTGFRPARWFRASIDPVWRPRDGFAPREWLAPVVKPRE